MSGQERGPIAKRWAVLVGIDRYTDEGWATLKYCVADVVALEQVLEGLGFEPVVCLHDGQQNTNLLPTKEKVEGALLDLKEKVGPNDLVFVHFACHGMLCRDEKDGLQRPFLAMMHSEKRYLVRQGWSVGQVEQWMRESGAKRLFLSLDACHTGVDMGRGVDDDLEFLKYAYDLLPEGLAVLSASTAQQQAKEWSGMEHGVYTYYLLEALSGKAVSGDRSFITVGDIERYVRVEMERFQVKNRLVIQEPTKWSVGRGVEDMKVVDWTGAEMPAIALPGLIPNQPIVATVAGPLNPPILGDFDQSRGNALKAMEDSRALRLEGIKEELSDLTSLYKILNVSYVDEKDPERKASLKKRRDKCMDDIKKLEVERSSL